MKSPDMLCWHLEHAARLEEFERWARGPWDEDVDRDLELRRQIEAEHRRCEKREWRRKKIEEWRRGRERRRRAWLIFGSIGFAAAGFAAVYVILFVL